ncbi:hypothetical protein ACX93W_17245 [Paenibacillus sp. CAU 1782]
MSNFVRYILLTLGLFCLCLATLIGVAALSIIVDGTSAGTVAADASGATASVVVVLVMAVPVFFISWLGRYLLQKARNGKPEASTGAKFGSIFLLLVGIIIGLTGISLVVALLTVEGTDSELATSSAIEWIGIMAVATFFVSPSGAAIWLSLSIMKTRRTSGGATRKKAPAPTKVPSSSSQYRMIGGEREPILHRPEKVPPPSPPPKSPAAPSRPETYTCNGCGAKTTTLAGEDAICDYCGTALRN